MNERMTLMLGPAGESRMHRFLGQRYGGCAVPASQSGDGMMGGNWRTMSRQDWQQLERRMLATRAPDSSAWNPLAIVAVTLAGIALLALLAIALFRRRSRQRLPRQPV